MSHSALLSVAATAADTASTDNLNGVAQWALNLMESLGAPGAGLAIALENLFPPLPSEIILPLAGFTASQGTFNIASVLFWTTLGSVVGALALYGLGALLGRERLIAIVAKVPLLKVSDVEMTERWFDRHGTKAVFFGRMIPIFRSLISIPAGLEKMNMGKFLGLTLAGSLIWNSIFVTAGYILGENWPKVEHIAGYVSDGVLYLIIAVIVVFVLVRLRSTFGAKKVNQQAEKPADKQ
ncbi:DedA family protein [Timonella senegalensis]|uniref:DedA family protein n=1 Tax=Timonella senegalensis TaxID=1465825 RepID=UPI0002F233CE|nr:DedA family protein [Timonella senegalensis]